MPRTQNRGGNRRGNNNNPEGKNQYSGAWLDAARERPATAAMAAAGAVAAGVFLWSKRAQISDQLSQLSDQISDWSENMGSDRASSELETVGGESSFQRANAGTARRGRGSSSTSNRSSANANARPQ